MVTLAVAAERQEGGAVRSFNWHSDTAHGKLSESPAPARALISSRLNHTVQGTGAPHLRRCMELAGWMEHKLQLSTSFDPSRARELGSCERRASSFSHAVPGKRNPGQRFSARVILQRVPKRRARGQFCFRDCRSFVGPAANCAVLAVTQAKSAF